MIIERRYSEEEEDFNKAIIALGQYLTRKIYENNTAKNSLDNNEDSTAPSSSTKSTLNGAPSG